MNYKVNSKVFATEQEANKYSRDLMSYGGLGGWTPTTEPVTHIYLGNLQTKAVESGK